MGAGCGAGVVWPGVGAVFGWAWWLPWGVAGWVGAWLVGMAFWVGPGVVVPGGGWVSGVVFGGVLGGCSGVFFLADLVGFWGCFLVFLIGY